MKLRKASEEVFIADEDIVRLGPPEIALVKAQALASPRRRARICAHPGPEDRLHEMLIAICGDSYIHPHRHFGKAESFHIVEGLVDVVMLAPSGEVDEVIELGGPGSGRALYYRVSTPLFHTLLIRTPLLVVHEVTSGPFDRAQTESAAFAPAEGDRDATARYMADLDRRAQAWLQARDRGTGRAPAPPATGAHP
jgi:cupin fold WbuC family metalloprotein